MNFYTYNIDPTPKPRMTQSDKWKKRDCVMRYRLFADLVRSKNIWFCSGSHIIFGIRMPQSWSKIKQKSMDGKPHKQRPDIDNLLKSLMDAVFLKDEHIYEINVKKVWAKNPFIKIEKKKIPDIEEQILN